MQYMLSSIKHSIIIIVKDVNCNINAAIKSQFTYNDAIRRTLFAQSTRPIVDK